MKKTQSQKNLFTKLTLFVLFSIAISSCAPGNGYQDPYGSYPNNCPYGNCAPQPSYGGYGYGNGNYDRYGRDPYQNREYWKNKDRHENHHPHHTYDAPPKHYDTVPPPQVRPEAVIRPNCPPDTTFDGRHCIVSENRRRSGGKGTVNACPKGMWLSGDRCVPN